MADRMLSTADVAERYDVPEQTVAQWRSRNQGPAYHKIGRHVRYDLADLEEWEKTQRVAHEPVTVPARDIRRARSRDERNRRVRNLPRGPRRDDEGPGAA